MKFRKPTNLIICTFFLVSLRMNISFAVLVKSQNTTIPVNVGVVFVHVSDAAAADSSSRRNFGKIPQAQLPSSQLHPSDTGRLNWGRSPVIVTPQLPEGNVPRFLGSSGARHEMTDDDTPEILRETSNPNKVVKVSSPPTNQKRVSPPQSRSRLRSGSPTGLRSGRKFILHAVPSFPPPTPYRNSKEGIDEIGNDDEATNKNNWTTQKESNKA